MPYLNLILSIFLILFGLIVIVLNKNASRLRKKIDDAMAKSLNLKYRRRDTKFEYFFDRVTMIVAGFIILGLGIILLFNSI
jgi:hypothetical protein